MTPPCEEEDGRAPTHPFLPDDTQRHNPSSDLSGHATDEEMEDDDSAYGEDSLIGDDTVTLSTYITDYRFEYGRRYHSFRDGAYWVGWSDFRVIRLRPVAD